MAGFPLVFPSVFIAPRALPSNQHVVSARLIVENSDGNIYTPPLVSASSSAQYPFGVSTADIDISVEISGTQPYYSAIDVDSIVRLQTKLGDGNWQDIFEGRVSEIRQRLGGLRTLHCRGHEEELAYRMPTSQYSGSSVTTGTVLNSLFGSYLDRLSIGTIDTTGSTTLTNYQVDAWKKYLSDVVHELEEIEAFGYRLQSTPSYNSDGTLASVSLDWQAVDTNAIVTPLAIEGTKRVLEAEFVTSIENLINDVKMFGDSVSATSSDATSISDYNNRMASTTDTNAATTNQAQEYADAIVANGKDPTIKGMLHIIGTGPVNPGDYIYCKFPSIYLDGSSIDGNYQIMRVRNSLTTNGWEQYLDIGEMYSSSGNVTSVLQKRLRLTNASLT